MINYKIANNHIIDKLQKTVSSTSYSYPESVSSDTSDHIKVGSDDTDQDDIDNTGKNSDGSFDGSFIHSLEHGNRQVQLSYFADDKEAKLNALGLANALTSSANVLYVNTRPGWLQSIGIYFPILVTVPIIILSIVVKQPLIIIAAPILILGKMLYTRFCSERSIMLNDTKVNKLTEDEKDYLAKYDHLYHDNKGDVLLDGFEPWETSTSKQTIDTEKTARQMGSDSISTDDIVGYYFHPNRSYNRLREIDQTAASSWFNKQRLAMITESEQLQDIYHATYVKFIKDKVDILFNDVVRIRNKVNNKKALSQKQPMAVEVAEFKELVNISQMIIAREADLMQAHRYVNLLVKEKEHHPTAQLTTEQSEQYKILLELRKDIELNLVCLRKIISHKLLEHHHKRPADFIAQHSPLFLFLANYAKDRLLLDKCIVELEKATLN